MSIKHPVFVLSQDGKPLTSTTPCRARKLLRAKVAKPAWSKFNTFGIRMLVPTREIVEPVTLGIDEGTKFEGYSVIVGNENPLNIKLDLPDKKKVVRKLTERRQLRRARRWRNCRRRAARFNNRLRRNYWLAPSQAVVVASRLKLLRELFRIFPITAVGLEDVRFNHARHRWGANFSTIEIGKARIRKFIQDCRAKLFEYRGFQTKELREKYGYKKTTNKAADLFTAHCCDSLALAVNVGTGERIEPGPTLVVDDTYRPVRRKLHDTQFAVGGTRAPYSKGSIFGTHKGVLVGLKNNAVGQLCGTNNGQYRFYRSDRTRGQITKVAWISNHFFTRRDASASSAS